MITLEVITNMGERIILDEDTVQSLKNRLRGELLSASDDDYDAVRQVWNKMIDKRPALKTKYDPTNLFRVNQNIKPTPRAARGL